MLQVEIYKSFPGFTLNVKFQTENTSFALLGASGCGKSMTLRCIAGIVKPDRGRIVLDGRTLFDSQRRINLPPQKRRAGLLFQNYALFPNMTVEGNILAGLRAAGNSGDRARLSELLETFRLGEQRKLYPAQLSGGQQQRAALARMFAGNPAIIMLDEPLSALDSYLRWQLEEELRPVIEEFPGPSLYVSHNRGEVYRLCKKVCVLNRGKSEEVLTVKELFEEPGTVSGALLSGCKNFSRAKQLSATRVLALDWGIELESRAVPPGITSLGLRAHYISRTERRNRFTCRIRQITEDVFSTILSLAPQGAENASIRMETPKSGAAGLKAGDCLEVGVAPEDILLLE